jgi:hypothetical protein
MSTTASRDSECNHKVHLIPGPRPTIMNDDVFAGLTASDFHHEPCVNPLDVFPPRSRITRAKNYRSPLRIGGSSRSRSRLPQDGSHGFGCCDGDDANNFPVSGDFDCCDDLDNANYNFDNTEAEQVCCDEPHHSSPSPMDCDDCIDDCDDCVEEHIEATHRSCHIIEDCDGRDHGDVECPDGPSCKEMCDECDFSCFECVDWAEFEKDKNLGLSFSVPLLDGNGFTAPPEPTQEAAYAPIHFSPQPNDFTLNFPVAAPLDVPMHHQCSVDYWNSIAQQQLCSGMPGLDQQLPLPPFYPTYGCHPATAHQPLPVVPFQPAESDVKPESPSSTISTNQSPKTTPLYDTNDLMSAVTTPNTSNACQWIMPCGTVCGASFATGTDLKKHIKTAHLVKGVIKCQWQDCQSADFASEAALTGHISKKHLASMLTTTAHHRHKHHTHARFACTFPGCDKSFMHKHIRDEHVSTHHGGNKMYCPICKIYLNGEGSNFKRHMATHEPKHQHMLCRFHHLGCKRRFPRQDNLRRHEACCKFGKKVGEDSKGHVHHHHHHHVHA